MMATPEALVKYYDCLKDSFNKIQLKDNKAALVNAALRPRIREELAKSKDVLVSYLNYIQVFTVIYSDKFSSICSVVICPLFKDYNSGLMNDVSNNENEASLIHNTVKAILKSKSELVDEYVHCLIKFFPSMTNDPFDTFTNYTNNCLQTCSYIRGEPLTNLIARILDRINPPISDICGDDAEKSAELKRYTESSYGSLYQRLDALDKKDLENVSAAFLAAFTREFLTSDISSLNYLVLYICSIEEKLLDLFINLLWATFTNDDRPFKERRASVSYACSFMSRANYVDLDKVLNYIETATSWCEDFLTTTDGSDQSNRLNETNELFGALIYSILYLITQRYREMYELDSIERLKKLNLDRFLSSPMKPIDYCDTETGQRFREVATLYGISTLKSVDRLTPVRKKQRSSIAQPGLKLPFRESDYSVPDRVATLYRNYYDHRNFTVYRD